MNEDGKKIETSTKVKGKKTKNVVIVLSTIIVLFLGLQVYASTNNYGNIFFIIKNLITTGTISGKDEIFSDRDITLSYKSIELAEGLKIQVNRLQLMDKDTKLFLSVKAKDAKYLPLKYEISIKNSDKVEKITGAYPAGAYSDIIYDDNLIVNFEINETDVIVLKISDSKDKEFRILEINLQTREIIVEGEEEFEKISEIELTKYLDLFSELNNDMSKDDVLLYIAQNIIDNHNEFMEEEDYLEANKYFTDRAFRNAIIKEFYGDKAKFEYKKQADTNKPEVEVLKGITGWEFDKTSDSYKPLTAGEEYKNGHCLKIEDISYENDIYTVKYTYLLATGYDEDDERLEDLSQYETTIKLKRDNRQLYSKYQVISIEKGTKIKEEVTSNSENSEVNNFITITTIPNNTINTNTTTLSNTVNTNTTAPNNTANRNTTTPNNTVNTNTTAPNNTANKNTTTNNNTVSTNTTISNTNTTTNNTTINTNSQFVDTTDWKEIWPEWIGMRFKCPQNFEIMQAVSEENGRAFAEVKGNIRAVYRENAHDPQNVEVKIWLYNEFKDNIGDITDYNIDHRITSMDNKGWSDWDVLKDEEIPLEREEGYIRRSYARIRDNQVEKVIFDMKAYGMDVYHYSFIRNVLESLTSTSV